MAHSQSGIQAMMGRVFLAKKNAIKDFLLRFFSEPLQFGDFARFAGGSEGGEIVNMQDLV